MLEFMFSTWHDTHVGVGHLGSISDNVQCCMFEQMRDLFACFLVWFPLCQHRLQWIQFGLESRRKWEELWGEKHYVLRLQATLCIRISSIVLRKSRKTAKWHDYYSKALIAIWSLHIFSIICCFCTDSKSHNPFIIWFGVINNIVGLSYLT